MRKFLISIAATGSALTFAAPAPAQYAQWAPPAYSYNPYNYGYRFNNVNFARSMQARVQRIRADVHAMHMRRILSRAEARGLDSQARSIERRIYRASRNGISPGEARSLENRIFQLQRRVAREAYDWDRRYGRHHRR